jgi:anti-sigma-K factor RskA
VSSAAAAVSIGFGRAATRDLTRVGLTLAPKRAAAPRWMAALLLAAAAFAAGLAAGELLREGTAPVVVRVPVPNAEVAPLRQQLEQARMGLRVADARSQELERQIDGLNQKLTEAQDELTFFRKAREGRKH